MRTFLIILAVLTLVVAVAVYAAQSLSGVWTAQVEGGTIEMNLVRSRDVKHQSVSMMGMSISIATLGPVFATTLTAPAADVKFSLDRAAGTLDFEGQFAGGTGAGHFTFNPSEKFVRDMEVLGYRGFRDQDLLVFAMTDLSPETLRELNGMGYTPTRQELDDIAIFRVTPAFISDMQRLGYGKLTLRNLTNLRVASISAKSVQEYRAIGYDKLTVRELTDFGLHRVTPRYIEELRKLGYDNLTPRQLIDMRIFDVTPEYIRKLKDDLRE